MAIDALQSKMIAWLRFPLMVGVVFIHAPINNIAENQAGISRMVWLLFSDIIPRMAVPLFFFISAFLFFYGMELTWNSHKKKLKSRFRSLFIPYLLWNIILIGIYFMETYFQTSKSFGEILATFGKNDYYRVAAQMWFLRDLMLMVVLAPFIGLAIRYLKYYWILLLFAVWYSGLWNLSWGSHLTEALFFFSCGAYVGMRKLNITDLFPKKHLIAYVLLYLLLITVDLLGTDMAYRMYVHRMSIILGCIVMIYIARLWTEKSNSQNNFLAEAAFFVYAAHIVLLNYFNAALSRFADSESSTIAIYFGVIFLAVMSSLLIFWFCKKYFRRTTMILMGGR